jgi:2'-5' RNA ligase
MYLDQEASRRIRTLWKALDHEGLQSLGSLLQGRHRPHLSLIAAEQLDAAAIKAALDGITVAPPLKLSFDFTGLFVGRILWLGVAPSAELIAHHASVYERLCAAGIAFWDHYHPTRWVPHCTLSMRVPNSLIGIAVRRCLEVLPIEATLDGAAVADHARGIHEVLS